MDGENENVLNTAEQIVKSSTSMGNVLNVTSREDHVKTVQTVVTPVENPDLSRNLSSSVAISDIVSDNTCDSSSTDADLDGIATIQSPVLDPDEKVVVTPKKVKLKRSHILKKLSVPVHSSNIPELSLKENFKMKPTIDSNITENRSQPQSTTDESDAAVCTTSRLAESPEESDPVEQMTAVVVHKKVKLKRNNLVKIYQSLVQSTQKPTITETHTSKPDSVQPVQQQAPISTSTTDSKVEIQKDESNDCEIMKILSDDTTSNSGELFQKLCQVNIEKTESKSPIKVPEEIDKNINISTSKVAETIIGTELPETNLDTCEIQGNNADNNEQVSIDSDDHTKMKLDEFVSNKKEIEEVQSVIDSDSKQSFESPIDDNITCDQIDTTQSAQVDEANTFVESCEISLESLDTELISTTRQAEIVDSNLEIKLIDSHLEELTNLMESSPVVTSSRMELAESNESEFQLELPEPFVALVDKKDSEDITEQLQPELEIAESIECEQDIERQPHDGKITGEKKEFEENSDESKIIEQDITQIQPVLSESMECEELIDHKESKCEPDILTEKCDKMDNDESKIEIDIVENQESPHTNTHTVQQTQSEYHEEAKAVENIQFESSSDLCTEIVTKEKSDKSDTDSIDEMINLNFIPSNSLNTLYKELDLEADTLSEKKVIENDDNLWEELENNETQTSEKNVDVIVETIRETFTEQSEEIKHKSIEEPIQEDNPIKLLDSFDDIEEMLQENITETTAEKISEETSDKLHTEFDDIVKSIDDEIMDKSAEKIELNSEDIETIDVKVIETLDNVGKDEGEDDDEDASRGVLDKSDDSIIAEIDSYFVENKTLEEMDAELTKLTSELNAVVEDEPSPVHKTLEQMDAELTQIASDLQSQNREYEILSEMENKNDDCENIIDENEESRKLEVFEIIETVRADEISTEENEGRNLNENNSSYETECSGRDILLLDLGDLSESEDVSEKIDTEPENNTEIGNIPENTSLNTSEESEIQENIDEKQNVERLSENLNLDAKDLILIDENNGKSEVEVKTASYNDTEVMAEEKSLDGSYLDNLANESEEKIQIDSESEKIEENIPSPDDFQTIFKISNVETLEIADKNDPLTVESDSDELTISTEPTLSKMYTKQPVIYTKSEKFNKSERSTLVNLQKTKNLEITAMKVTQKSHETEKSKPELLTIKIDDCSQYTKSQKQSPTIPKIRIKPIVKPSENVTPVAALSSSELLKQYKSDNIEIVPKLSIKALKKSLQISKEEKSASHEFSNIKSKLSVKPVPKSTMRNLDKDKQSKISMTDVDKISIHSVPPKITIKQVKNTESFNQKIYKQGIEISPVSRSARRGEEPIASTSGESGNKKISASFQKLANKSSMKPELSSTAISGSSSINSKLSKRMYMSSLDTRKNPDLLLGKFNHGNSPQTQNTRSPKSERILLKINKDNESMKSQLITEPIKKLDPRFEFDKLKKITLKLSKEGGHPEIMQSPSFMKPIEASSSTLKRMLSSDTTIEPIKFMPKRMKSDTMIHQSDMVFSSPDLSINIVKPDSAGLCKKKEHIISDDITIVRVGPEKPSNSGLQITPINYQTSIDTSVESKLKEILMKYSHKKPTLIIPEHTDSNSSEDVKIIEETDPIIINESYDLSVDENSSQDVMIIDEIIVPDILTVQQTPPPPRKRGRPRKVPLVVRPDLKEEDPIELTSTDLTISEPRSKRACVERRPYTPRTRRGRGSRGGNRGVPRGTPRGGPRGGRRGRAGRPRIISPLKDVIVPLLDITDCKVEVALSEKIEAMIDQAVCETKSVEKTDPEPEIEITIQTKTSESVFAEEDTRMSADEHIPTSTTTPSVITEEISQIKPQVIDIADESRSSTNTVESNRNKRGRLEISEIDTHVKGPEQIAEYSWGQCGPYMLQEQVAQYLGVKSFKRKYPGLTRHAVDMQERDYLRENGLASEALCDMGLTAVPSSEILDIMFTDFQDKYEEYRKYQREKQAKDVTNKQKALSLATSADKGKVDCVKQAVRSAASWNETLNRTRSEQRRCYMDLQTFTVMYPQGHKIPTLSSTPGNYPVALVPGQFTDYYKNFTTSELNYLPLNTVIYGPVIPNKITIPEVGQSDGSCSDSDSSSGSDSDSSDSSDSSGDDVGSLTNQSTNESCKLCTTNPAETPRSSKIMKTEQLIHCTQCNSGVHPGCIDLTTDMLPHIRAYQWQCTDCKTCWQCREPSDDDKMLFCDRCDRGYHIYCVGLRKVPTGTWHCQQCTLDKVN